MNRNINQDYKIAQAICKRPSGMDHLLTKEAALLLELQRVERDIHRHTEEAAGVQPAWTLSNNYNRD